MEEYIRRQQNTVSQYIATRSLVDLCEGLERSPGAIVGMWWWEQAGIGLVGSWEVAVATSEGGRGEEWRREVKEDYRGRAKVIYKCSDL